MRKRLGIIKRVSCIGLVFLLSINSFAAIVSDNDGAAFITKAEFDALKNDFQSQIDNYNNSIDNKIDGAIASYLAGISLSTEMELNNYYKDYEVNIGGNIYWVSPSATMDSYFDCQNKANVFGLYCDLIQVGNTAGYSYCNLGGKKNQGLKVYDDSYICDSTGYVINVARRFALNQRVVKAITCGSGYANTPYFYPIESTSDGGSCWGGGVTWSYGTANRYQSDWTNLRDAQILNQDFVDWHLDYDTNNSENKTLVLYPGSTTNGLDSSVWGTKVPAVGDSLRFAYMGMKGYESLVAGAMRTSSSNTSSNSLGTALTSTTWTLGQSSQPSKNSRQASITSTVSGYITSSSDLLSKTWSSGGSGCKSAYVIPYWDSYSKNEVYPVYRRVIGMYTSWASVSCRDYTLTTTTSFYDCMYYCGYVYGLRKNIGSNLGSIKLRWPTDLVGSDVKLCNGIPVTKTQKDGIVKLNITANNAGTLYVNKEKVSDILTDSTTQTFSLAVGSNNIDIGQVSKEKYIYISYKPTGTSTTGYTLTVDSCKQIISQ